MGLKEKIIGLIKRYPQRVINKHLKHICRACHHIFDEDEMSVEDTSICKECSKRE